MDCVSWHQLMEFATWIDARLPTEAEWKFAASSRGQFIYPWGDSVPDCSQADHWDYEIHAESCAGVGSSPVCTMSAGNTLQGLCDMAGNILELVQDEYNYAHDITSTDGSGRCDGPCPTNSAHPAYDPNDTTERVQKSGNYSSQPIYLRAAYRHGRNPTYQSWGFGGRLVRSLP